MANLVEGSSLTSTGGVGRWRGYRGKGRLKSYQEELKARPGPLLCLMQERGNQNTGLGIKSIFQL